MWFTVAVAAAALGAASGDARKAAQLEAWGELAAARAEVEAALARDPKDPTALLVAACVELEEGDLPAAEARTRALAAAGPRPQAKVLRALIERRRRLPGEPLRDALAPAWNAAGRPDLQASALPGVDESLWLGSPAPRTDGGPHEQRTPGESLLFGGWDPAKRRAEALAAAVHPEQNAAVVNQEILAALHAGEGPRDAEAEAAILRVGEALAGVAPDNGYWEYIAWLGSGGGVAPLSAEDLDRLTGLAARPRFELPRADLLRELRSLAARFDPEHASCLAGMANLRMGPALVALQRRAEATSWDGPGGAERKARTAAVLVTIGRRLAASRTYLERMIGVGMVLQGAKLAGDRSASARAEREAKRERSRHQRATAAAKKAGTWPFSSLCADWSPDEVGWFERYLD